MTYILFISEGVQGTIQIGVRTSTRDAALLQDPAEEEGGDREGKEKLQAA